jgi:hypothetical protein
MHYITSAIRLDLQKKMVFIGGPRQVGKTTLARHLLADAGQGRDFNWDYDEDRRAMLQKRWSVDDGLLRFRRITQVSTLEGMAQRFA